MVSGMPRGDAPSHRPHHDSKPDLALENVVLWFVWKEGACIGRLMPGKGCTDPSIHETAAEFAQGHHWGHWLFLQAEVLLSLIPPCCEGGCRDCLCENQCTWHSYHEGHLFSSLRDLVTIMSQDPKQLKEVPSQGAWGVLGLSVGAPGCQGETAFPDKRSFFTFRVQHLLLVWPLPLEWAVTVLWPLFSPKFLYEKTPESRQSTKMYLCPPSWWKLYTHEMSDSVYNA